ncbi:hypothetical protein [Sphingobium sp.]|uniref:hypothetical protein n=1 Tax=Sphingobium sp. TaxID=1912891 RepID=UPI0025FD8E0D|nr:hypothetical protein [Sphingobium sp.]
MEDRTIASLGMRYTPSWQLPVDPEVILHHASRWVGYASLTAAFAGCAFLVMM